MAYDHPAMHTAVAYAALITFLWLLSLVNKRLAYGPAREVDLEDEVIVVTGGASGLGLLIAEVYGMRGASVAVLDIMDMDGEEKGIEYYKCDVGDREQVEKVAKQIENDVRRFPFRLWSRTEIGIFELILECWILAAWYAYHFNQQCWNCQWEAIA